MTGQARSSAYARTPSHHLLANRARDRTAAAEAWQDGHLMFTEASDAATRAGLMKLGDSLS